MRTLSTPRDNGVTTAIAGAVPIIVGAALVGIRGEIHAQITVLVFAVTVVLGAAIGGRAGGTVAAITAAASFDFFHTEPYRSLKMSNGDDMWATILLLILGLAVGQLQVRSWRTARAARRQRDGTGGLTRVLQVAGCSTSEDVELTVRAELIDLLSLQDCWFTPDVVVQLPTIDRSGHIATPVQRYAEGGFELPADGVAVPVFSQGHLIGNLVCVPIPRIGVPAEHRRLAIALADVLGLAMGSTSAAA